MSSPLPFCAEQRALPGLPAPILDWLAATAPVAEAAAPPGPDQLSMAVEQPPLAPPSARSTQLPLLPDPPLWEMAEGQRANAQARRRSKSGSSPARRNGAAKIPKSKRRSPDLSPGQMSLF